MKRLLFIFPHPDDESFACAGTMAKYHEAGHEILLICATFGCKGKPGGFTFTCREELANHRKQELLQAARVLGVNETIFFGYPDGGLAEVDVAELTARIRAYLLELKPDIIVTFPPDGVTGHPDHIALSRATEQAVLQVEQTKPCDFYYVSIPKYYDHCADQGPKPAVPITGKVDVSRYREQKAEALRAHESQIYSVNRAYPGVMQGDIGVICHYEYYTLIRSHGEPIEPKPCGGEIPVIELV
ncbi:PIG-L family deacetylase [Brevibacillus fluminis]|uniref:PIG-L family deacetylase n=1 Tax=Brevibacillus fluminis TaxID=511487 RepID=A0A3M8DIN6_9BACL|nr:PIG-L family deacetylase [Brevibacillus fluminis]RNB87321.1 PIG-L family deacetylase [Brevibacillus fluminis]